MSYKYNLCFVVVTFSNSIRPRSWKVFVGKLCLGMNGPAKSDTTASKQTRV